MNSDLAAKLLARNRSVREVLLTSGECAFVVYTKTKEIAKIERIKKSIVKVIGKAEFNTVIGHSRYSI